MAAGSVPLGPGRPRKSLNKEDLEYLRNDVGLSWEKAAALLGISAKTLQRRAREWSIQKYSHISDAQLDEIVSDILQNFPSSGQTLISGHLQARKVCYHA